MEVNNEFSAGTQIELHRLAVIHALK